VFNILILLYIKHYVKLFICKNRQNKKERERTYNHPGIEQGSVRGQGCYN
jgi:translation initiation factor 2 beta subunit (eIF-2beta)/eIF-5